MCLAGLLDSKNCKSAWIILLPDRNSNNESPVNNNLNAIINQHDSFLVKNEHFYLKAEDKNFLLPNNARFNDRIMDATQALICKTLGIQEHYQSVLHWQKRVKPYKTVIQECVQLLHDDNNHWFLNFFFERRCSNMWQSQLNLDSDIE